MNVQSVVFKFTVILTVILTLLCISFHCQSAKHTPTVNIGSYLTPRLVQENGKGLFNHLNRQIFAVLKRPMNLTVKPIQRTNKEFKEGEIHAYFPELWEKLPGPKSDYIVSDPIFYKKVILFTRKHSRLTTLADFENKILGLVTGYSYGKSIANASNLNLSYHDSDETNIRLLANNRIDGVLGGFPSTVIAVSSFR